MNRFPIKILALKRETLVSLVLKSFSSLGHWLGIIRFLNGRSKALKYQCVKSANFIPAHPNELESQSYFSYNFENNILRRFKQDLKA